MNKRLHTRLALIIIGIAAGIVLISTISVILTTHYHFSLYQAQAGMTHELPELNYHLEQALMQTINWTCIVAIVLAVFLGFYVAKTNFGTSHSYDASRGTHDGRGMEYESGHSRER
ncbi:hypothetical protein PV433_11160 [Paenibacillus sp. GYB004]|uniref:hypothetical protein n=1 Tax=Paenibacillus sp. GYB004 TaxID=2994393 RepID=UPI002F96C4F2